MNSFEFTIVATGVAVGSEDWQDRFYDAGCSDALIGLQRGVVMLHFDREALSASAAIDSACADVRRAGATIKRIEPDPLVSISDIAERAGVTRQAVSLYVAGERGVAFPEPVACVSSARPLWRWVDVAGWLHARGSIAWENLEFATLIDDYNQSINNDNTNKSILPRDKGNSEANIIAQPTWRSTLSERVIIRKKSFQLHTDMVH